MIASAVRSRVFELRRDRAAAHRSAELLDRKREVLLREVLRRERHRAQLRGDADAACDRARRRLDVARVEHGLRAIETAALAQPQFVTIAESTSSLMAVRITRVSVTTTPFQAHYGAASTMESLDDAGIAFTELLPLLIALAEEEAALARLRVAMRKTTKLLNALRKVVLPRIERELRMAIDGIEEEERDEAVRRRSC